MRCCVGEDSPSLSYTLFSLFIVLAHSCINKNRHIHIIYKSFFHKVYFYLVKMRSIGPKYQFKDICVTKKFHIHVKIVKY